jgi:hypothetical protein
MGRVAKKRVAEVRVAKSERASEVSEETQILRFVQDDGGLGLGDPMSENPDMGHPLLDIRRTAFFLRHGL